MTEDTNIPIGDIKFYDNYIPALPGGNYTVNISQTLDGIDTGDISASSEFLVIAPQFSLDPTDVNSLYPPKNHTGQFADVLPHIVLDKKVVPWEREMSPEGTPWLALMVFSPDELIGAENDATRSTQTKVSSFMASPAANVFRPVISKEKDVQDSDTCYTIQFSTDFFKANFPLLDELKYLTHVRQLNTGDKSIDGLKGTGWYSVVVANRFPFAKAGDQTGQQSFVHLVSVEGMEAYLDGSPNFAAGVDTIELLSLARWSFRTLPDNVENFKGLMQGMVAEEGNSPQDPDRLWLRLPSTNLTGNPEAKSRIDNGYVPLNYQVRSGEQSYAWYRGPLAPSLMKKYATAGMFPTADAAMIYDEANGLFDLSLATAWQTGRMAALADKDFGTKLLDWRRKTNALVDKLYTNLQFLNLGTDADLQAAAQSGFFRDQFESVLQADLIKDLGTPSNQVHGGNDNQDENAADGQEAGESPVDALKTFMADPNVVSTVASITQTYLEPVALWLAKLQLLYQVPFNNLVADAGLLPMESMRFFYQDPNWMSALQDGALSIGLHSSRDSFFSELTADLLDEGVGNAVKAWRNTILGDDTDVSTDSLTHVSGFLMRSALVAGWPGLSVKGMDASGNSLKILRMDRLSDNVLLVMFWGVPSKLELSEPQEGFRFGVDEQGSIELRKLDLANLGDPINTFQIRDLSGATDVYMRPGTQGRVLNLAPSESTGLIQNLESQLSVSTGFGPADFALEMVKSPEMQTFNPPS